MGRLRRGGLASGGSLDQQRPGEPLALPAQWAAWRSVSQAETAADL